MIRLFAFVFRLAFSAMKLLAVITVLIIRKRPRKSSAHGSARFATKRDLKGHGMLRGEGLVLGRHNRKLISAPEHGHLLCIAPTGSGKTTGLVLPNLLTVGDKASIVAIDPKGELVEAGRDNRLAHGPVYHWAPFRDICHAYNPLEFVRLGTLDERDDADLLTSLLIPIGSNEEAFWSNEARSLMLGLILYVLYTKPEASRTMASVRSLLLLDDKDFSKLLHEGMAEFPHPIIQSTANAVLQKDTRQLAGVLATAQSKSRIWDSPRLTMATCTSDFTFANLKEELATIFLTVPPAYLDTYYPAIRVLIGLAIAEASRTDADKAHRVMFMLDEFANLGRLAPAEAAISIARGAGIQLCLFVQDISQFRRVYGEAWASFAANCDTKVFFGVNDISEAKRISETIGAQTIRHRYRGTSTPVASAIMPDHISSGEAEIGRALITPDEILNLSRDECLILQRGIRPIKAKRLFYLDREFRNLVDGTSAEASGYSTHDLESALPGSEHAAGPSKRA